MRQIVLMALVVLGLWSPPLTGRIASFDTAQSQAPALATQRESKDRRPDGLILQASEGERMVRRWGYPMTIKVDPRNGGSERLVAITEEVPPGQSIPLHNHSHADEIVLLLEGSGIATVGERRQPVNAGGLLFIPKNAWVGFENTSTQKARVFAVFSALGYDQYLRVTSVPEDQPVTPLSPEEQAAIRRKFKAHIFFKE
jgi:quercetin dioxygenase-like cupin family protein